MKQFYLILFLLIRYNASVAQISSLDTTDEIYPLPISKVTLHMTNGSMVKGTLTKITDSALVMSVPLEIDATWNQAINIHDVKSIKVKKNAFWVGMGCGAIIGGLLGYGIGHAIENDPDLKAKNAVAGAAIVGVPSAVVGSVVGAIAIKRNFAIDGDKQNIEKMMKTLSKEP